MNKREPVFSFGGSRTIVSLTVCFDWPYSGITIRTFSSKKLHLGEFWCCQNTKENFSIVSGQNVMDISSRIYLQRKIRDYFVYSYSRIASIERALSFLSGEMVYCLKRWPLDQLAEVWNLVLLSPLSMHSKIFIVSFILFLFISLFLYFPCFLFVSFSTIFDFEERRFWWGRKPEVS